MNPHEIPYNGWTPEPQTAFPTKAQLEAFLAHLLKVGLPESAAALENFIDVLYIEIRKKELCKKKGAKP